MKGDAASPHSPFLFADYVYSWLDNALDMGISEIEFWSMTLAELERKLNSIKRVRLRDKQEKATFDYILADLIGRSVARVYNSSNKIPEISEVYPMLFNTKELQEQKQEKVNKLSELRFRQFAQSFNSKYKEGVKDE